MVCPAAGCVSLFMGCDLTQLPLMGCKPLSCKMVPPGWGATLRIWNLLLELQVTGTATYSQPDVDLFARVRGTTLALPKIGCLLRVVSYLILP